jgi:TDG/mug DNA glycosylase family protein
LSEQPPAGPTRAELEAAYGRTIPDVIAPDLDVLFVGINPSLYSGAVGHHFARPGNRFWKALHGAGFTERLLSPYEGPELLAAGIGLTNLVDRSTRAASEISSDELVAGGHRLVRKARRYRPGFVTVVGVTAFRQAFAAPLAQVGPQEAPLGGARAWVLPNPSGLNAHYQLPELIEAFGALRREVDRIRRR